MSDAPAPLIRLRGITKVYGEGALAFKALKGVDLDIGQGEFVAIMGPSGSGKSTAMNILGCLDTPSAGQYLFHGAHVEALSRDQRARLRRRYLGFVFQGFNLLARTSAQENVELPLLYRGEPALHAIDFDAAGFDWIDGADSECSVLTYLRKSGGEMLLVAANFTPVPRQNYLVGVPKAGRWRWRSTPATPAATAIRSASGAGRYWCPEITAGPGFRAWTPVGRAFPAASHQT